MAYKQLCYITLLTVGVVSPQSTIPQNILDGIFGTPPATVTSTPRLEDVTRRTTDSTTTFVKDGQSCKCVPYYLCSENLEGVDANNVSVTGWGTLDIRFREDDCQESVERCCTNPKTIEEATPPPVVNRPKGCGYRNPKGLDFTVSGGSGFESQFGEFPWVIALLDAKTGSQIGGGVLIHPSVVMTGAHNMFKVQKVSDIKIRAGEWDTQTIKERLPYQERNVVDIISHELFNSKSLRNNIALLRLESPVEPADHINIVCLPNQDMSFEASKDCVATGWGKDVFGVPGRYAVILKRVDLNMVPHARCQSQLQRERLGQNFKLDPSFVCAGGEEGKDTCQGDGGAPLVCPIGNDRYRLTGLVAWGLGCGKKNVPGVYTNVAKFRNWIDDKMTSWGYQTIDNDP